MSDIAKFMGKILKFLKSAGVVALAVFIFYGAGEIGFQIKYWLDIRKANKENQKFNEEVLKLFQEDKDGGKTPEQTFNLFVDALKNEDVDLAIKYIVLDIERKDNYWNEFNEMKQKGELKKYAENFPKWEDFEQVKDSYNDWEKRATVEHKSYYSETEKVKLPDGAGGYIETELPPGNYVDYSIILIKNINNIWKIESL